MDAANFLLTAEKERLLDETQHLHKDLARLEEENIACSLCLKEVEEERDSLQREMKKTGMFPPSLRPSLPPSV